MKYKIRKLTKKDQTRISGMFLSLVDKIEGESITEIISAASGGGDAAGVPEEERKARVIRVFFSQFVKLIKHLGTDVKAFFADLIGVTVEEYDTLPFDIDMQIITQLKEAPEVENFFTGALRLYSQTGWFGDTLSRLKERFASASDTTKTS